jgi:restriction system protein
MPAQKYFIDVRHSGLNKFQRISGSDPWVVKERADAKQTAWAEEWERRQGVQRERDSRATSKRAKEQKKEEAEQLTEEAESALSALEGLLSARRTVTEAKLFDGLRDHSRFDEPPPIPPQPIPLPAQPLRVETTFTPAPATFGRKALELVSPHSKQERLAREHAEAEAIRQRDEQHNAMQRQQWESACLAINARNAEQKAAHQRDTQAWTERRTKFEQDRSAINAAVDRLRQSYRSLDSEAVEQVCEVVLSNSQYPDGFPHTFQVQHDKTSKTLVVDYTLPSLEHLPTLKSVKYVQSKDDFSESHMNEAAQRKQYDSVVYQLIIRTFWELFQADSVGALDAVVFNGFVDTIDKGTGKAIRPCIASVRAERAEFAEFDLSAVDPKACFRRLKGLGSAQLNAFAPIAPIMQMKTDDVRLIEGRHVIEGVNAGMNLAAMDWEDFEHLVRDLFEREFGTHGAEVRVTRASHDGGVDAIVFDPDPIRGGKFIIQAKRYTNVVGVSAVRDLYGTMIAEGAGKGILVTTAHYGADAYSFAKDKPIVLLDGSNLLHLLQKHGVSAHIDIASARQASAS